MPGLGPSILFAAGLAVGVGAGVLYPRKSVKETVVLPPPPEGNYRGTVSNVPTPTGHVALQGGFPGESRDLGRLLIIGPTPDIIQRIAYTAGYDRAKRHPAWVCICVQGARLTIDRRTSDCCFTRQDSSSPS